MNVLLINKASVGVNRTTKTTVETVRGGGFDYMSVETLLDYCRIKLQQADAGIRDSMSGLDKITSAQQSLTDLKSAKVDTAAKQQRDQVKAEVDLLKSAVSTGADQISWKNPDGSTTTVDCTKGGWREAVEAKIKESEAKLPDLEQRANAFDARVNEVCDQLDAVGQADAAKALREAADAAGSGDKEALDKFQKVIDAQVGSVGASREMAMVRMQGLVSQRGTMLQMITNMMNSLNEAPKAIANNCR